MRVLNLKGESPQHGANVKATFKPGSYFLLLCLTLVYGMYVIRHLEPNFTFSKYDPGWMIATVISIVEDRDLDLRNQLNNDPGEAADQTAQGSGGEWYPLHEYLMAFATVPFYVLFGIPGCLIFNVVVVMRLMMVLFHLCSRHVDQQTAFVAVALTAFATLFLDYTYSYSLDVFGVFLLVASYRFVVGGSLLLSGFVWAIAVAARIPNAVTAPAFLAYIVLCGRMKPGRSEASGCDRIRAVSLRLASFAAGALPMFLCLGLANWSMFGSPLATGYSRWQHFDGARALVSSQDNAFSASALRQLPSLMFDTRTGLFFGAPLLVVALSFGLRPLWRKSKSEAVLFGLISLCTVALYSKYSLAVPGYPGNRYLMSVVALAAIPLGLAVKEVFKGTAAGNELQ